MKNSFSLNAISHWLCEILIAILICYYVSDVLTPKEQLNFVELQMKYKHYTVADKYQKGDTYVLCLVNPITKKKCKVYVAEYLYMCVYFVGDTIK